LSEKVLARVDKTSIIAKHIFNIINVEEETYSGTQLTPRSLYFLVNLLGKVQGLKWTVLQKQKSIKVDG
jgi:hypothetical protein